MAAINPPHAGARSARSLEMTAQRRLWNRVTQAVFVACALILVVVIVAIIPLCRLEGADDLHQE